MAIQLNDNLKINAGKPIDTKYLNADNVAYTNTAQVISQVPIGERYRGLIVNVAGDLYWFANGVADGDLVLLQTGGGDVDQTDVCYVGKWGNDTNDGLTPNKAKLTIQAAVNTGRLLVRGLDRGDYNENITISLGEQRIIGNFVLEGDLTINATGVFVSIDAILGNVIFSQGVASEPPTVDVFYLNGEIRTSNSNGIVNANQHISQTPGFACVKITGTGNLQVNSSQIEKEGTTTPIFVIESTGIINVEANKIKNNSPTGIPWNIASGGKLLIDCPDLTGLGTGASTGTPDYLNGSISKVKAITISSGNATISFDNQTEVMASVTVNDNCTIVLSNAANWRIASGRLVVSGATRTITWPTGTRSIEGYTPYTKATRELELPVGTYGFSLLRLASDLFELIVNEIDV